MNDIVLYYNIKPRAVAECFWPWKPPAYHLCLKVLGLRNHGNGMLLHCLMWGTCIEILCCVYDLHRVCMNRRIINNPLTRVLWPYRPMSLLLLLLSHACRDDASHLASLKQHCSLKVTLLDQFISFPSLSLSLGEPDGQGRIYPGAEETATAEASHGGLHGRNETQGCSSQPWEACDPILQKPSDCFSTTLRGTLQVLASIPQQNSHTWVRRTRFWPWTDTNTVSHTRGTRWAWNNISSCRIFS